MDEHLPLRARWLIVPLVLSMVLIALFIYTSNVRRQNTLSDWELLRGLYLWWA